MGRLNARIVPVTVFQQNCTILFGETDRSGVVVDPGGDVGAIRQAIGEAAVSVSEIWLTHGHIDHAGGARPISSRRPTSA